MGAMSDIGDPVELTKLLSIGYVINDPATHRAQNTGDKVTLNEVIDNVRAILSGNSDVETRWVRE